MWWIYTEDSQGSCPRFNALSQLRSDEILG